MLPLRTTIATPGTFTATLTVTDAFGLTGTATASIDVINTPPVAAINASATSGVLPFKMFVSGAGSTDAENNIATYNWDFGDGTTGTGEGVMHEYTSAGVFPVVLTVTDAFGLQGQATVNIEVLTNLPPTLEINSPVADAFIIQSRPQISLSYNDNKAVNTATLSATANGSPLSLDCQFNATFATCTPIVDLPQDTVTLAVTISDFENLSTTASTVFFVDSIPVEVAILTPDEGAITQDGQIEVTGAISDNVESVEVNGVAATITNLDFSATVPLREGKNMLIATGRNINGKTGVGTVDVTRDIQKPIVRIDSPRDGFPAVENVVTVTGIVNDIVDGGVAPTVKINGISVPVVNGTFIGVNLELGPGPNTIEAIATDAAGNVGSHSITVNFQEPAGPKLMLFSGNGQKGEVGTLLTEPLIVHVVDNQGLPVAGRRVHFEVIRNNGTLATTLVPGLNRIVDATTDGNGQAQVSFTLGTSAGGGNNRVRAMSAGVAGEVEFCVTGLPKPPDKLISAMGDNQRGVIGEPLPIPLEAFAADPGGNPAAGIPVTFSVVRGGGNFGGQPSQIVVTGDDGIARAVFTLGFEEGFNNNLAEASFEGLTGLMATFIASGIKPGDPANTTFTGVVLDSTQQPIPGATVFIDGTPVTGVTDADGQFLLTGVPVGPLVLHVDPSTSPRSETFPPLEFEVVAISGVKNTLDRPVILPQIATEMAKIVGGNEDVVLEMKGVPGMTLTVFANSATFPDGSTTGLASVSQVHMDQVPMQPPNGTLPPLAGTLQPLGAKFDPPVRVQFPNVDGLPPGTIIDLFQFHHDTSRFVPVGKGTVTEDGQFVVSDPGFGLQTGGWHDMGPPPPPPNCNKGNSGAPAGICWELNDQCQWDAKTPPAACDDGNTCTENDQCNDSGACQPGPKTTKDERCVEEKKCGYGDRCQDGECVVEEQFSLTTFTVNATADNSALEDNAISVKKGKKIQFTPMAEGVDCGGDPTGNREDRLRYKWDLGDGNVSPLENVNHSYVEPGVYMVETMVTCGECKTPLKDKDGNLKDKDGKDSEPITVIVIDVESKDRFAKISIGAKDGEDVDFTLMNGSTHVATVLDFLNNPLVKIYNNENEIFTESDTAELSAQGEVSPVAIVRNPDNPEIYDVYTVFDNMGEISVDVTVTDKTTSPEQRKTATLKHTLKPDAGFSEWIDLVAQLAVDIPAVIDNGGGTSVASVLALTITAAATATTPGENRGLIARTLITVFKGLVNVPISLVRGIYDGLIQGFKDDLAGLQVLGALLTDPVKTCSDIYNALNELTFAGFESLIFNLTSSLLDSAENSITWSLGQVDGSDVLATRAYIAGFTFGYLVEQVAVLFTGAGIVVKAGLVIKTVLAATKVGQVILSTISTILKFKARLLYFASQTVRSISEMTRIPKMVQGLGNTPFGATGKTFGEFLAGKYTNFKKPMQDLRKAINGEWDTLGEKFMENWADTTNRLLGGTTVLTESATEGFFQMSKRLLPGGDLAFERYTDFLKLVKADGVNTIPTDLANTWFTKFKAAADTGVAQPKLFLEGIERVHPTGYIYYSEESFLRVVNLDVGLFKPSAGNLERGVFASFDLYTNPADAKKFLQLGANPTNTALYRHEFSVAPVNTKVKVPYAENNTKLHFEPTAKDNFSGTEIGGGTQVLVETKDLPGQGVLGQRIVQIKDGLEKVVWENGVLLP